MDPFNDREKAFEAKYHVDEELAFKIHARRDKLLGRWVAQHLGLRGQDAELYAQSVVDLALDEPRFEAVIKKLLADLNQAKATVGVTELQAEAQLLSDLARRQIIEEAGKGEQTFSPS